MRIYGVRTSGAPGLQRIVLLCSPVGTSTSRCDKPRLGASLTRFFAAINRNRPINHSVLVGPPHALGIISLCQMSVPQLLHDSRCCKYPETPTTPTSPTACNFDHLWNFCANALRQGRWGVHHSVFTELWTQARMRPAYCGHMSMFWGFSGQEGECVSAVLRYCG